MRRVRILDDCGHRKPKNLKPSPLGFCGIIGAVETFRHRALRKLILALDGLIVVLSMGLAFGLHSALRQVVPLLKDPPSFNHFATLAYLTLPLFLVLVAVLGLHRVLERPAPVRELVWGLVKLHLLSLVGLSVILFATQAILNRSLMAVFLGCTFLLLFAEKVGLTMWVRYQHSKGHGRLRLLLVGRPGEIVSELVDSARCQPLPPRLVGLVTPAGEPADDLPDGLSHLGTVDELDRLLHDEAVDRVLFFPPVNRPADVPDAVGACEALGVPADFAVDLSPSLFAPPRVLSLYEQPFISLENAPKAPEALAIKHGLDAVLAAAGLVALSPLLLLTALAILVTMGRPVLFIQRRGGLHGRSFRMFKFRTMVPEAEARREDMLDENEMSGPVFKVADDPRVTGLGHLLRMTSVDELPQLFNVLIGEMSLVGPRPLPEKEQQQIRGWRRRRLSMKPGITGLWQVSGRNTVDFEEWMKLDLRYVDRWSLRLDAGILLRTIPAVLFHKGAR